MVGEVNNLKLRRKSVGFMDSQCLMGVWGVGVGAGSSRKAAGEAKGAQGRRKRR